jgi:hypothetical protein
MRRAAIVLTVAGLTGCGLTGCGSSSSTVTDPAVRSGAPGAPPQAAHPVVVEPNAGDQQTTTAGEPPVGDPTAHAPPLSQVKAELRLQIVQVSANDARYIDPLGYVTQWERTDQGVDASMPIGAPILAPCRVKILAIIPGWFAGQPLVYFELLDGSYAGRIQYVAEQITSIARPGSYLQKGQTIATFAKSGTDIEYGWSTANGITLAVATTGYEEGEITPAGRSMRAWLNALGAGAGPDT